VLVHVEVTLPQGTHARQQGALLSRATGTVAQALFADRGLSSS
jgi:hypothetical protein